MKNLNSEFYVSSYEIGTTQTKLPLWGNNTDNSMCLNSSPSKEIIRNDLDDIPGAFQLLNVLSAEECQTFINTTESLGYTTDAAVSLSHSIRHNMNLNWVIDDVTERLIWSRVSKEFNRGTKFLNKVAFGLNQRFRFYRYAKNDYFDIHSDGSWPGSKIIDRKLVTDAFGGSKSLYTFLIFLSDQYTGGKTLFQTDKNSLDSSINNPLMTGVRTPVGGVLCFPHGNHPLNCMHGSEKITNGLKYIIRTDVLFK